MANITVVPSGWIFVHGSHPSTIYTAGQTIPTPSDGDTLENRASGSAFDHTIVYEFSESTTIGGKSYTNIFECQLGSSNDLSGTVDVSNITSINGYPVVAVYSYTSATHSKFTAISGLPQGVEYLNFPNVTTLTSLVSLPSSVLTFKIPGCTGLTTLPTLNNGLNTLVATGCTSLTNVSQIPSTVKVLTEAFSGCTSLEGLIRFDGVATSYADCFKDTTEDVVLYGKGELISLAKTANNRNVRVYIPPAWKSAI